MSARPEGTKAQMLLYMCNMHLTEPSNNYGCQRSDQQAEPHVQNTSSKWFQCDTEELQTPDEA